MNYLETLEKICAMSAKKLYPRVIISGGLLGISEKVVGCVSEAFIEELHLKNKVKQVIRKSRSKQSEGESN